MSKRVPLEDFVKDPLGKQLRLANIANLNDELKSEIYENRLSKHRAKIHATETGLHKEQLDVKFPQTQKTVKKAGLVNNPLNSDERFKQLFK